jgi:hypothetical protein
MIDVQSSTVSSIVQMPVTLTPAIVFVVAGATNPLEWAEYEQGCKARIDANQDHRAWLAAHGLSHIDPSELFAG